MSYSSPLRYPGGKRQLTNFLKLVLATNDLQDGHYVEVYAGGASIAFSLLFHEYIHQVHINDLSHHLFAFWHSVLNDADRLCALIDQAPVEMDEWYRQKEIYEDVQGKSLLEIGFATFFLNRTNRSGILNGGVIGGKGQNGNYSLDARFNKPNLKQRIQRISRYRERIKLYNLDAAKFLTGTLPGLPARTLVYLDPPYYIKGKDLYADHYTDEDHAEIARIVTEEVKQSCIVSYDNVPAIRALYRGWPSVTYGLNYSATDRYEGKEVMFFSPTLRIPEVENPIRVKANQVSKMLDLG